jgi:CubicO group peptidase (beta-lactamase class C family)
MPNGEGYAGGGVYMRPRDLLKIGQVFLDNGTWKGRRIVRASWVKRSTSPPPEIYGADAAKDPIGKDGLAWHLSPITSGGHIYYAYNANGNGGQVLLVVPELDLTVVFTGGNYRQGNWIKWIPDIVGGEIIPAIDKKHFHPHRVN